MLRPFHGPRSLLAVVAAAGLAAASPALAKPATRKPPGMPAAAAAAPAKTPLAAPQIEESEQRLVEAAPAAAAPTPAPAPTATPAPVPAATAAAPVVTGVGLGIALKLDAYVTQGRTFGVDLASGKSDGWHGLNVEPSLELSYWLPLPAEWRLVGLSVDAGYTPFLGTGYNSLRQYGSSGGATGLSTTRYRYDWAIHLIPLDVGLKLRLPLERLGLALPLRVELEGGFASGVAFASSTLTIDGTTAPFSKDAGNSDIGLGYYAGAGVAVAMPPGFGSIVGGYRYSAVRLDFHRPDFNATWGDLGGHHLVVGYRFEL